ncbi:predicted protein, partial [Nematostella vectensis]
RIPIYAYVRPLVSYRRAQAVSTSPKPVCAIVLGKGYTLITILGRTDKGKPCSGPAFSTHMKSVFYHLTGVSVNLHLLRSSFVTYCYGDSQCTDAMKDSLASALRHTRKQAQLTYDRRNSSEKKSLAVSLASELAENTIESLSAQPSDRNAGLDKGSWVALTVEGSTLANPNILLARIQNLMPVALAVLVAVA